MIMKSRLNGKWVLEVFENFQIDRNLPKHKKEESDSGISVSGINSSFSDNHVDWKIIEKPNWKRSILKWIEKLLGLTPNSTKGNPNNNTANPLEILLSVKGSLKEAQDYLHRISLYDAEIQSSKDSGQVARYEKLVLACKIVKAESMLLSSGFGKYMTEETAIEFADKCQKGLRLDWIKNFTRPIPPEILSIKKDSDKLKLFDNYVIMHYDPTGQSFSLTKQQEEAKKDPILFGVMEGIRKLYFIGDWKDDVCDLTLEEIEKVIGKSVSIIDDDPTKDF